MAATIFPDNMEQLASDAALPLNLNRTWIILGAASTATISPQEACRLLRIPVAREQTAENCRHLIRELTLDMNQILALRISEAAGLAIVKELASC